MTTFEVSLVCNQNLFLINCSLIPDFKCRGGWKDNGTNYLIASSNEDDIRQYCLAYDETGNELQMTISSETCLRKTEDLTSNSQSHRESHLALSLVNKGLHLL